MKILVCEDERFARQSLVKQIISLPISKDFEVFEAKNGKEGLDIFKRNLPEIVLLDIKMPQIDGLSLLKLIMEHSPKTKVMMTSGYAYFNYSQEAINLGAVGYLLKPINNDDLTKFFAKVVEEKKVDEKKSEELGILKNSDKISQVIYNSAILNRIADKNEVAEEFEKVFGKYRIVVFYFENGYQHDVADIAEIIQNVFDEEKTKNVKTVSLTKHMLCIVLTDTDFAVSIVSKLHERLMKSNYVSFVGVSNPEKSIEKIPSVYQQAVTALKSHIFSQKSITCYQDLKSGIIDEGLYSESDLSMVRLLIEKSDCDTAIQIIKRLIAKVDPDGRFSVSLLENILMKISTVFVETVQKNNLLQIQTELMGFDLLLYNCIDDIEREILRRAKLICTYVSPQGSGKNDNILSIVKSYINENYNKDISLKYLAEKVVFLNHTYLSHLIHEKTGKSYSTFLREIRVEKARELLLTTDLSITEVATMCGYNDTSQFIRVFKKEVGLTPKKVKDQSKNNVQFERIDQHGKEKKERI